MRKIKFCRKCNENHEEMFNGYFNWLKDDRYECPIKSCRNKLIVLDIDADDFDIIYKISHDNSFLQAMIKLKETDAIEYNLKMSQFRTQIRQQESSEAQEKNTFKCPKCGSTNIQLVKRKWTPLMGFMTDKVDRICVNCKNRF